MSKATYILSVAVMYIGFILFVIWLLVFLFEINGGAPAKCGFFSLLIFVIGGSIANKIDPVSPKSEE